MKPLVLLALFMSSALGWAKSPTQEMQISVNLLGQPCTLSGPFQSEQLKTIHAVGPAQLYPNLSPPNLPDAEKNARKALQILTQSKLLPTHFDRYQRSLSQRLRAQIEFLQALNESQKQLNPSPLIKVLEAHVKMKNPKLYEQSAKKLSHLNLKIPTSSQIIEQIFEDFNEEIEPDPEQEFHRALKKLNIQYKCSFEESEN